MLVLTLEKPKKNDKQIVPVWGHYDSSNKKNCCFSVIPYPYSFMINYVLNLILLVCFTS